MYGVYATEKWVRAKQPVYIRRKDGVIQRYWKWKDVKIVTEERGRYEFYGSGRDLYEAIRIAKYRPPNKYVDARALGYTDRETVKLDLDSLSLSEVKKWAMFASRVYELDGGMVLESSEGSYHVLFDDTVSWSRNVSIMAGLCLITKHGSYVTWVLLQCRKGCSTLRISAKGEKPPPKIVYQWGNQDNEIFNYLHARNLKLDGEVN